jgi:uncharacterized integral membrane protein
MGWTQYPCIDWLAVYFTDLQCIFTIYIITYLFIIFICVFIVCTTLRVLPIFCSTKAILKIRTYILDIVVTGCLVHKTLQHKPGYCHPVQVSANSTGYIILGGSKVQPSCSLLVCEILCRYLHSKCLTWTYLGSLSLAPDRRDPPGS